MLLVVSVRSLRATLQNLIAAAVVGVVVEFVLVLFLIAHASPAGGDSVSDALALFHRVGLWLSYHPFRSSDPTVPPPTFPVVAVGWLQCFAILWVLITGCRRLVPKVHER